MKVGWQEDIREEDITLMDKEFITVDFESRESDLIYEVKANGEKVYFVLLEIQSKVDRKMAYRLLNYMVEIWRKCEYNRKKNEKFTLPVIIPCVLYDGIRKWSAPIEFKNLYNSIKGTEEYLINFKYILIDIHRYKPDDLLKMGSIISSAFYLDTSTKQDMEDRLKKLAKSMKKANKDDIEIFKQWLTNVFVIDKSKKEIIEKEFEKEEEEMGNLARIVDELCKDAEREGRKIERSLVIRRLLSYKLKIDFTYDMMDLIDNATMDQLEMVERRIFEINSWEEVERTIKDCN